MNPQRLASDYEALQSNEFWKAYLDKVKAYQDSNLNMLRTAAIEKVPHLQGELKALGYIISLPAVLAETLANEVKL